jgi:hypothetical protein
VDVSPAVVEPLGQLAFREAETNEILASPSQLVGRDVLPSRILTKVDQIRLDLGHERVYLRSDAGPAELAGGSKAPEACKQDEVVLSMRVPHHDDWFEETLRRHRVDQVLEVLLIVILSTILDAGSRDLS